MNEEIAEYYEELYNLCAVEQEQPLARRYRQLREALERVMRQQMMGTGLQACSHHLLPHHPLQCFTQLSVTARQRLFLFNGTQII